MSQGATEKRSTDELSGKVIGACIEVHRYLGPGLLEAVYEECLCRELGLRGVGFQRQVAIPVRYKGLDLDCAYRSDLIIESSLIVEIKAVDQLLPIHQAQLITYLKLTGIPRGLLVNFHVSQLREGLRRVLNPFRPPFLRCSL